MKDDERELLARLQAQFGDMDVGGMLEGSTSNNFDRDDVVDDDDDDVASDSSLEEPTAEELHAWQEAQYEKGRKGITNMESVSAGNVHRSALQSRRQHKTSSQLTLMRESDKCEEADEWVKLTSTPDLGGESSLFFPNIVESNNSDVSDLDLVLAGGVNPLLQKLVEGDPEVLGTKWTRLFSSSDGDGLSFRNLCDKIRGYDGPTVLLIGGLPSASKFVGRAIERDQDDDRVSLGFFTTDSWIETTEYFGSDDCFLFAMDHKANSVHVVRPKASPTSNREKRYMYCHPSSLVTSKMRGYDGPSKTNGSVHGIGIGGTASQPRLHITESLEECRALSYDRLFDDGDLLLGKCTQSLFYFDVDCIEVWAVGGDEWISHALRVQKDSKQIHAANLKKARTVEKIQFLDDFQSGLTCANQQGLFGHRDLVRERCDL
ncbi:hypothetical protein ACHAXH_001823 [Discostella pseudostelligera]